MARVAVIMPKMGESVMEGTVLTWHKQVGEAIASDEDLLEIGTDKVDSTVPSPAAGILAEIVVPEGETVEVNTIIAYIETDSSVSVSAPAEAPAAAPSAPVAPVAAPVAPAPVAAAPVAPASATQTVEVVMPKMGESVMEGTVLTWHKQVGEAIAADEDLLEIGTDKVDSMIPSPAGGILHEIIVPEGETVEVGTVLALIAIGGGVAVSAPVVVPVAAPVVAPVAASAPQIAPAISIEEGGEAERMGNDGRFYSPLVRSMAKVEGISQGELERLAGSGHEGRVTKKDVQAYLDTKAKGGVAVQVQSKPAASVAPKAKAPSMPSVMSADGRTEIIEMDRMRQIIAEHMVRSKGTSAHVTSFAEIDVSNLVALMKKNKEAFLKREGVKLTYTPFFVQAAIEALREHPWLNASVEDKQIIVRKDYHIGIAVALEEAGLIVPSIRNAGSMNLIGLAHAVSDVANRARSKQLLPDELQGGTFTVTNIGSLGSIMGTPIINQPQVGILAVGAIKKRPVVIEHPEFGDIIAIRSMMFASLSYDHRIVDGAMAASFLRKYTEAIENIDPNMML